jgi:hypothetical protein
VQASRLILVVNIGPRKTAAARWPTVPGYMNAGRVGALMSYEHAAKRKRPILTVLHRSTEKPVPRAEVSSARVRSGRFGAIRCGSVL